MKFLRGSYKTKKYAQNCPYVVGNDMSLMLYWERLFYMAVSTTKREREREREREMLALCLGL